MSTSGIQPTQYNASMAYQRLGKANRHPPPPPIQESSGDTVEISAEAMQQRFANVPASVTAAVSDLQGDQTTMAADFRTIGDYFAANGGRAAQDAYMRSNFTEDQLRAMPPPVDGFIESPGFVDRGSKGQSTFAIPDPLAVAVADLKGSSTSMGSDLKAIGDYFREHGGREAHRDFMRANFSEEQRAAFRQFRQASTGSTESTGSSV
jgi:hypothetical protein